MILDELEQHIKELDVLSRHEEVKQARDRALAEINTMTNRIKGLESEIERLRTGKEKCEGDAKDLRNNLEKKEDELKQANDEIKVLRKQLADCKEALPRKSKLTLTSLAERGW